MAELVVYVAPEIPQTELVPLDDEVSCCEEMATLLEVAEVMANSVPATVEEIVTSEPFATAVTLRKLPWLTCWLILFANAVAEAEAMILAYPSIDAAVPIALLVAAAAVLAQFPHAQWIVCGIVGVDLQFGTIESAC